MFFNLIDFSAMHALDTWRRIQRESAFKERHMFIGRRILIVEDQPLIVASLGDILDGFRARLVGPAMTIEQAMHLAESETIDAAIVDIWLRGQACYPVGDVLARRGVPFAVMGGRASESEPSSFRQAPRLPKPFTSDELAHTLYSLL